MLKKFSRKILSTVLAVAMIGAMSTNVMASEVENGENNQDYTVVASITEELGDGLTLVKELSVKQSDSRIGFSGSLAARVSHSYYQSSGLVLEMASVATFTSTLGVNECNLVNPHYVILKEAPGYRFANIGEDTRSNQGSGVLARYAKYDVKYDALTIVGGSRNMWVKCDANASTSTSGDQSYQVLKPNQVMIGNNIVSFG